MKQVPRWVVLVLLFVYIIVFAFQMKVVMDYISGAAPYATVTLYAGTNRAPYLNITYPNLTWYRYSSYVGPSLNDYFVDPDGDPLTYTVYGNSYILIIINQTTGVPSFSPLANWWGIEHVWFNATDPRGLSNISNLVVLNVTYREIPPPPQDVPGGNERITPTCFERWICTDWSKCIDGWQTRKCTELNKCGTQFARPPEGQECHIDTCDDGIKNCPNGECEEDIDCGGPCPPCGNCFDNLKNCHNGECEEDIDCGGPCLPCMLIETKNVIFNRAPWILLILMLIAIFLIEAYIYYIKHYKIYRRYYRPFGNESRKKSYGRR